MTHEWLEENFMTIKTNFYQKLCSIMHNGKEITVSIGYMKLHTQLIHDKKLPANKYQSKYD